MLHFHCSDAFQQEQRINKLVLFNQFPQSCKNATYRIFAKIFVTIWQNTTTRGFYTKWNSDTLRISHQNLLVKMVNFIKCSGQKLRHLIQSSPIFSWGHNSRWERNTNLIGADPGVRLPQGRNEGAGGKQFPRRRITMGAPKSPNNVTSTSFNTVNLLP